MPRIHPAAFALLLGLAPAARADDSKEAKEAAVKFTTAGAAMFEARDARGLALTYTDDARLDVYSKDADGGSFKLESHTGRADVEAYYKGLFDKEGVIHARNTVEHARLIAADVITVSGIFEPNTESPEPLKLPFTQVRVKKGDAWKIVSLQLFIVPQK